MNDRAAVADLKAHLSHYLRRVKAGDEVVITERNIPIARLVPLRADASAGDRLDELEAAGLASVGRRALPADFWTLPRPSDPRSHVRRAVDEERQGGW